MRRTQSWIENEEKISKDESLRCIEKYRLQLANCVEVETWTEDQ